MTTKEQSQARDLLLETFGMLVATASEETLKSDDMRKLHAKVKAFKFRTE